MRFFFTLSMLGCLLVLSVTHSLAQLSTARVFSSDMILQQGKFAPVWGKARAKATVDVIFANQRVKTKADDNGFWMVELAPLTATKTPCRMTVKSGKETIIMDNILVGEVWLCSGQSNMQYSMRRESIQLMPPVKGADLGALELTKDANPMIRVFRVGRDVKEAARWKIASGESLKNMSALGYFFIKTIHDSLDVPVGIISSSVGGTRIEPWTCAEAYEKSPYFAAQFKASDGLIDNAKPASLYRSMIEPLAPFALRGFLWYQGESNCSQLDRQYAQKYEVMVKNWREIFRASEAPFYSVLLGPHTYSDRLHKGVALTAEELPMFWQQQINTLNIPNSEVISVSDLIDNVKDIHPSYKWIVGERMARVALSKTYDFSGIICSGPRLKEQRVVADSIELIFDYCANGLKTNDNMRLNCFEISGADGVFCSAIAEIRGKDTVRVYHRDIKKPTKIRFCWHETAMPNLVNSENLPALPFGAR